MNRRYVNPLLIALMIFALSALAIWKGIDGVAFAAATAALAALAGFAVGKGDST